MTVQIVDTLDELRVEVITAWVVHDRKTGLVPTMGALHAGHAALIQQARRECDYVVVSIFVNPTQFGPNEDFHRYPRPFEKDVALCEENGVDLIFHPAPSEIYPPGYNTYIEVTTLQDKLCGASRPGHFRGVATVVYHLFRAVEAVNRVRAYFGQKDAQQVRVIQQMIADLRLDIEMVVMPTVREADGLALSSRNQYLDAKQRRHAPALWQALCEARRRIEAGERDANVIQQLLIESVAATPGAVLDYAAVVDAKSLDAVERLQGEVLLALAVKFGATRLIDNVLVTISA